MTFSIGQLVNSLNINHHIQPNHPIFDIPINLFEKDELADLLTIIILVNNEFIDNSIYRTMDCTEKESSFEEYALYVQLKNSIVIQIENHEKKIEIPQINTNELLHIKLVNQNKIESLISIHPVFKKLIDLIHCRAEYPVISKYIHFEPINPSELDACYKSLNKSAALNLLDIKNRIITKLLFSSKPIEEQVFSQHNLIECYLKLDLLKDSCTSQSEELSTLEFTLGVIKHLSQHYPVTIGSLISKLGIILPNSIKPDLKSLLETKLDSIPAIQQKDWPKLVYYTLLLLFNHAQIEPEIINYSYCASDEQSINLLETASEHLSSIQDYLDKDLESSSLLFNVYTHEELQDHLRPLHFNNPRKLGLLCLDNLPPLKTLLIQIWKNQGIEIKSSQTCTLLHSPNHFIIGKAFFMKSGMVGKELKLLPMNEADFNVVENMARLSRNKSDYIEKECHIVNNYFKVLKDNMHSKKGLHDPHPKLPNNSLFFSSFISNNSEPHQSLKHLDMSIERLRLTIHNPELKQLLYGYRIGSVILDSVIDYQSLAQFVLNYENIIDRKMTCSSEMIDDFLKITEIPESLNLIRKKILENSQQKNQSSIEITKIQKIISQLEEKIKLNPIPCKKNKIVQCDLVIKHIYQKILCDLSPSQIQQQSKSVDLAADPSPFNPADKENINEVENSKIEFRL